MLRAAGGLHTVVFGAGRGLTRHECGDRGQFLEALLERGQGRALLEQLATTIVAPHAPSDGFLHDAVGEGGLGTSRERGRGVDRIETGEKLRRALLFELLLRREVVGWEPAEPLIEIVAG